MTRDKRRRRIMREFVITELSAVDRPAQEPARMAIIKRAEDTESEMDVTKIASFARFGDAVAAVAKSEDIPTHEAMSRVRAARPDLVERYNAEGREAAARAATAAEAARAPRFTKAELAFEDRVDEIAKARGIPRHAAMSAARTRYPDEFEAAYGKRT